MNNLLIRETEKEAIRRLKADVVRLRTLAGRISRKHT